jgi:hypothetical protein
MPSMTDAFSERRITFDARSQTPKRAAAIPLTPVSAWGMEDAPEGADEAEPVEAVLAGAAPPDAAFDDAVPDEEGTVTAIASICAFSAAALKPPESL